MRRIQQLQQLLIRFSWTVIYSSPRFASLLKRFFLLRYDVAFCSEDTKPYLPLIHCSLIDFCSSFADLSEVSESLVAPTANKKQVWWSRVASFAKWLDFEKMHKKWICKTDWNILAVLFISRINYLAFSPEMTWW